MTALRGSHGGGAGPWRGPGLAIPRGSSVPLGRNEGARKLARGLGWFSLGLGAAQLLAPRQLNRLIGLWDDDEHCSAMRAAGARELAHGLAILAAPEPKVGVLSRVLGDGLDLALLGRAYGSNANDQRRVAAAAAAVAGVTALDLYCGQALVREDDTGPRTHGEGGRRMPAIKTITVDRPVDEVRQLWASYGARGAEVEEAGRLTFRPAPGGRGTEIRCHLESSPPGGKVGGAIAKYLHRGEGARVYDVLREFKQLVEVGEVVRSDATATPGPHPGQPIAQA